MPPPTNLHQKLSLFNEIITTLLRNFYKSAKKHAAAQAHHAIKYHMTPSRSTQNSLTASIGHQNAPKAQKLQDPQKTPPTSIS